MVKVSQRLLSHHFVLWVVQRKLTPNRSLALLFILMRGRAHAATREAHGKPSYDRAAAAADGRMMHNGWAERGGKARHIRLSCWAPHLTGASQIKGFRPLLEKTFPSIYRIFRASQNSNRRHIIDTAFAKSQPLDARVMFFR